MVGSAERVVSLTLKFDRWAGSACPIVALTIWLCIELRVQLRRLWAFSRAPNTDALGRGSYPSRERSMELLAP